MREEVGCISAVLKDTEEASMRSPMTQEERYIKMTETPISRLIPSLAIPTIISMLVTSIYNMADTFFVSRISTSASAAVGVSYSLMAMIQALGFTLGMGSGNYLSRVLGSRDEEKAERIASTGFYTAIFVGLVFAAVCLPNLDLLVRLLGATDTIAPYAKDYAKYILMAAPVMTGALSMNNLLRFQGLAVYSMIGITTGGILNMILDPIFIFGFDMGVQGAALATVLSQAISAVWAIRFLSGKDTVLKLKKENFKIKKEIMLPCIGLGAAPFIMQSTESILVLCFNSSLLKYGGDLAVGAMTILSSVMQFAMLPLQGLTQGGQPIISYNFGANNAERVRKGFRFLLLSAVVYAAGIWAVSELAPGVFVTIFTNDPQLAEFAKWAMRIYMAAVVLMGAQIACQQTFIAFGNSKISAFLAMFRKIIVLIPLIYILPVFLEDHVQAVFLAEPIADVIAVVTTLLLFRKNFKKVLSEMKQKSETQDV